MPADSEDLLAIAPVQLWTSSLHVTRLTALKIMACIILQMSAPIVITKLPHTLALLASTSIISSAGLALRDYFLLLPSSLILLKTTSTKIETPKVLFLSRIPLLRVPLFRFTLRLL